MIQQLSDPHMMKALSLFRIKHPFHSVMLSLANNHTANRPCATLKKMTLIEHRANQFMLWLKYCTQIRINQIRNIYSENNQKKQCVKQLFFFIVWLPLAGYTQADISSDPPSGFIDKHYIKESVHAYANNQLDSLIQRSNQSVEIQIGHIDDRLRLAKCGTKLSLTLYHTPLKSGRNLVQVTCSQPKSWRLLVPVTFMVKEKVVVMAQSMTRGRVLQPEHLMYSEKSTHQLHAGYYVDMDAVVGSTIKRSLASGQVLTANMLSKPKLIHKDQEVTIQSQIQELQIKTTGIALNDGHLGDWITVKNKQSQRVIKAEILGKGLVGVNP